MSRLHDWRIRWYARRFPNIPKGAWLYDLGRPTPHAVLIKQAYEYQQRHNR